jgi:hypothetical protein
MTRAFLLLQNGLHVVPGLVSRAVTLARCLPGRRAATTIVSRLSSSKPRGSRLVALALATGLAAAGAAVASEPAREFWPELDVWLRLSPQWRLSTFIPFTENVETGYREGALLLQADYAWGKPGQLHHYRLMDENRAESMKAWLVRGGYLTGRSLADDGQEYTERTILLELHARTPLKGGVLVSHRLRSDLRWLGRDDAEFSYRWRYRVMAEKEFVTGSSSIVPYVNVEPYYDSRYGTVNRVRLIGGASVAWSERWALEGNVTYQHDSRSSVTDLYALNVILHLYFEIGRAR